MLEKLMDMNVLLYGIAAAGVLGTVGMLTTHLTYRRAMKSTKVENYGIKEKWLSLWKTRDRLLRRMDRMLWYSSLLGIALLCSAFFLVNQRNSQDGLPLSYLYLGVAVPVLLLLLRQALDFTYKEELILESLADYVEHAGVLAEEHGDRVIHPVLREELVDQIAESIRQSAATGSHFSRMLAPEEEEILREVIREFMD